MTDTNIRVSIVIATKDRYETLFNCVDSLLLNYHRDDVEIIIRDNSAEPQTEDFSSKFASYSNVVYVYERAGVSQSENVDKAVTLARGEFVTLIGDDDGIAGGLLDIASWMKENEIDAFYPGFSVYLWPGVSARLASTNKEGRLYITKIAGPRVVSAPEQRNAVLASGCTSLEDLPRLYYGLVRNSCLDQLRSVAGNCFPGPSPDMANAFALSYLPLKFVTAHLPIFIAGNSRKSAAGLGLRGRHVGEIHLLPFLPSDTAEVWNYRVPYFWSGPTIWCQSAYLAAKSMGKADDFVCQNSFYTLYARLFVFQPRFAARILAAIKLQSSGYLELLKDLILVASLALKTLLNRFCIFASNRLQVFSNQKDKINIPDMCLNNVIHATKAVDHVMQSVNIESLLIINGSESHDEDIEIDVATVNTNHR